MNPNEFYDNLHDGFEKSMSIPLVVCSDYASCGDFDKAVTELFNFNETFLKIFFFLRLYKK